MLLTVTLVESDTTTQSSWFQTLQSCICKLIEFPTLKPSELCDAERPLLMLLGASPSELLRIMLWMVELYTAARFTP